MKLEVGEPEHIEPPASANADESSSQAGKPPASCSRLRRKRRVFCALVTFTIQAYRLSQEEDDYELYIIVHRLLLYVDRKLRQLIL